MKNLIFTAALLLAAITTATAQSLKVGNVTITYNKEAAQNIGFSLDVTNNANGGSGSGLCRDAAVAIKHTQTLCNCVLTPNEALKVYSIAKQEPPQWLYETQKATTDTANSRTESSQKHINKNANSTNRITIFRFRRK